MTNKIINLKLDETNVARAFEGFETDFSNHVTKSEAVQNALSVLKGEHSAESVEYSCCSFTFSVSRNDQDIWVIDHRDDSETIFKFAQ